ncbi:metallophosphoesterase [Aureimonas sp. AU4]|uniref:metallophosphoesterase n=1 Tax=Aureimonas sp. AU4 TaxID=1638163 RepID=UPI0007865426|nr:metallophosphoesterase [Aureimonas sp. AU4]
MRIWIMSDLHDDFSRSAIGVWQPQADVDADVLVVAGDIAGRLSTMGRDWLENQVRRLGIPIVVVAGNHDAWGGSVDREIPRFRERQQADGIHVLDGDTVEIADVRFVGGTLWTDYGLCRDGVHKGQLEAQANMNDFRYSRMGTGSERPRLTPQHVVGIHARHKAAIVETLAIPFDGPTVVVTHHAPSPRSLRHGQVRERLDAAYASDLEDVMHVGRPALWVHGHIHCQRDYRVFDTRVICNPRGYVRTRMVFGQGVEEHENAAFDPRLVVEV